MKVWNLNWSNKIAFTIIFVFSLPAFPEFKKLEIIPGCFSANAFNDVSLLREQINQKCVQNWANEQTKATVSWLGKMPLATELKEFLPSLTPSNPILDFDFGSFKMSLDGGILRMIQGEDIKILVGKESLAEGGLINDFRISPDKKKLIFSQIISGSDVAEWRFYDLQNFKILEEKPIRIRLFQINWSDDSNGVYYSAWPSRETEEEWIKNDKPRIVPVSYRRIGSLKGEVDEVVFTSKEKVPSMVFAVENNGPTLFAFRFFPSIQGMSIFVSQTNAGIKKWKQIKNPGARNAEHSRYIGRIKKDLYFLSNRCGPSLCITKIDMDLAAKESIVVKGIKSMVITEAQIINDSVVIQTLDKKFNVSLKVYSSKGKKRIDFSPSNYGLTNRGKLLPVIGSLHSSKASFVFSSFETYPVTFKIDLSNSRIEKLTNAKSDPDFLKNTKSDIAFYKSLDGTKVPIQIYRRKDVTGPAKFALLYYYGAINISSLSTYNPRFVSILKMGGIVAIANVRGGGELGEKWSRSGSSDKLNKTIRDIVSASRWIKKNLNIQENRVIAEGGSWGGAHTYMTSVFYPEEFTAFVALVPVANPVYAFKGLFGWLLPDDVFFKRNSAGDYEHFDKDIEKVKSWTPLLHVPKLKNMKPILTIGAANDERTGSEQNYMMPLALKYQFGVDAPAHLIVTQGGGHKGSSLLEELTFIGIQGGVTTLN